MNRPTRGALLALARIPRMGSRRCVIRPLARSLQWAAEGVPYSAKGNPEAGIDFAAK